MPEAVAALGLISAGQRRKLGRWAPSCQDLKRAGFTYRRSHRLWCRGPLPRLRAHQLAVAQLLVDMVALGHPPEVLTVEPRLPYRSPAGGARSLDPDALLHLGGMPVAVEVDRGTESGTVLRHKWWRYREYGQEVVPLRLVVVAPLSRLDLVAATLAQCTLAEVGVGPDLGAALAALAEVER
ncbi:MAG: replication-relaxation family protein [Sulfobacillus sp.]